jgi:GTP cyclohydrolase I
MNKLYKDLLSKLGEEPDREGLLDTPERAAKAMEFLTQGYHQKLEDVINDAIFTVEDNHMIIVKDIELYSLDLFARRLQIQERLTTEVADSIMKTIAPEGVGVVVEAQHLCMMMRGVEKQNSCMITSAMLGSFRRDQSTRNEFLQLIRQ